MKWADVVQRFEKMIAEIKRCRPLGSQVERSDIGVASLEEDMQELIRDMGVTPEAPTLGQLKARLGG